MYKKRPQPEESLRLKTIPRSVSYMSYPDARDRTISIEFKWNVLMSSPILGSVSYIQEQNKSPRQIFTLEFIGKYFEYLESQI